MFDVIVEWKNTEPTHHLCKTWEAAEEKFDNLKKELALNNDARLIYISPLSVLDEAGDSE